MKKIFLLSAALLLGTLATWAQLPAPSFTIWPEESGDFTIYYSTYGAPTGNVGWVNWGDGIVEGFERNNNGSNPNKGFSGNVTKGTPIKIYSNYLDAIEIHTRAAALKCESNNPQLQYIYYFEDNLSPMALEALYESLIDRKNKNWGELHLSQSTTIANAGANILKSNAFAALDKKWQVCSMQTYSGSKFWKLDEANCKSHLIPTITLQIETINTTLRIGIMENFQWFWVERARIAILDGNNAYISYKATRPQSNIHFENNASSRYLEKGESVVKIYGALVSHIKTTQVSELNISGTNNLRYLSVGESLSLTEVVGLNLQTQIHSISLIKNTAIKKVDLPNLNQLSSLNVSGCSNLEYLDFNTTNLYDLRFNDCVKLAFLADLSDARRLKNVSAANLGWDACKMDGFYNNLYPKYNSTTADLNVDYDTSTSPSNDWQGSNHTIPTNKGWQVKRYVGPLEEILSYNGGGCQAQPELSFTIFPEQTSTFKIKYSTKNAALINAVYVDWGDGVLQSYGEANSGGANPINLIQGNATAGKAIKIYSHYIEALHVQSRAKAIRCEDNNPELTYFYYFHNNLSSEALEHLYYSLPNRSGKTKGEIHLTESPTIKDAGDHILKSNVFMAMDKDWVVCSNKGWEGSDLARTKWMMGISDAWTHLIPAITLQSTSTNNITDLQLGIKARPEYPFDVATSLVGMYYAGTFNYKSLSVNSYGTDSEITSSPKFTLEGIGASGIVNIYGAMVSHISTSQISSLDLTNTNNLRYIRINNCAQLTDIPGLENQELLDEVNLMNNINFSNVNLEASPNLKYLNVGLCPALTNLYFDRTSLEFLGISLSVNLDKISPLNDANKITTIYAENLGWDACALDDFYGNLPSVTGDAKIYVHNNYIATTANTNGWRGSNKNIATDKGWTVYRSQNGNLVSLTGDGGGCTPEGISEVEASKFITLYPNPVSDLVNITIGENLNAESLQVVDFTGKTIFNSPLVPNNSEYQINVSDYAKGIYLIRMGNFTRKLIVK